MPLTIDEELGAIRRLHNLDTARWAAEGELERTPKLLREERGAVDATEVEKDRLEVDLKLKQAQVREGEQDLSARQARLDRARGRIPFLTSATQIETTEREIATRVDGCDLLEGEILEMMEEADDLEAGLRTVRDQVALLVPALAERTEAWDSRRVTLEEQVAQLTGAREEVIAPLSSELQRLYRGGVRASTGRREKGGATTVKGTTCDTCWAEVPARWINQTITRKQVHCCQTCKRILLVDPTPDEVG
jgi:predicted  nucleic acid-binding Zn-ribbon protein